MSLARSTDMRGGRTVLIVDSSRNTILPPLRPAIVAAESSARGVTSMPTPRGTFIWYDVMTTDTKAAAAFYSHVIGWDAHERVMADDRIYTVFSQGQEMAAGVNGNP